MYGAYAVTPDDPHAMRLGRVYSDQEIKDTLSYEEWEGIEKGKKEIIVKIKAEHYADGSPVPGGVKIGYLRRIKPQFRQRSVIIMKGDDREEKTLARVDGKWFENGEPIKGKIKGKIIIKIGRFGNLLEPIQEALQEHPVNLLKSRRLIKNAPTYSVLDGASALKVKGNTTKTGRVLKKFVPGLTDAAIQEMARIIDEKNPVLGKIKDFERVQVRPYSYASATPDGLGSCMWRHGWWELFEELALFPAPTKLPDANVPWADGTGPCSLIFTPSAKEVHEGRKHIRAFMWPVIMNNGDRKWFIDRVYPANNHARKFIREFAQLHGYVCRAEYEDAHKLWPGMAHVLRKHNCTHIRLPYMDTFTYSGDILYTGEYTGEKTGSSKSWDEKITCPCGERHPNWLNVIVEGRGATFPICPPALKKLEPLMKEIAVDGRKIGMGVTYEQYKNLK